MNANPCADCGVLPEINEDPLANIWNRWRLLHLCKHAGRGKGCWTELQSATKTAVVTRWNAMNPEDP